MGKNIIYLLLLNLFNTMLPKKLAKYINFYVNIVLNK